MKLLTLLLTLASCVFAQGVPCTFSQTLTGTGSTTAFDNRTNNCQQWNVSIAISGFTFTNVAIQGAADSSGSPGTFTTIQTPYGPNPTQTTSTIVIPTNGVNWIHVNVLTATGSGSIVINANAPFVYPPALPVIDPNIATHAICAKGSDTITGITCYNTSNATSETWFPLLATIPANYFSNFNTFNFNLQIGWISTVTIPSVQFKLRLGGQSGTLIFQGTSTTSGSASGVINANCTVTQITLNHLVTSCNTNGNLVSTGQIGGNTLISNSTLAIAVSNTDSPLLIDLSATYSAGTAGNAVWLYSITQ